MKFKEVYKLISEDKVDDLVQKYNLATNEIKWLNTFYNNLPITIKSHNKFGKFLDFLIKDIKYVIYAFSELHIIEIWKGYLKYNLKLEDYNIITQLMHAIDAKTNTRPDLLNIDPNLAKKIYEDTEKVIILPLNMQGSIKYGSRFWCISTSNIKENLWNGYLGDGFLSYFILYKSSKAIYIPDFKNTHLEHKNFNKTCVQLDTSKYIIIFDTSNSVRDGIYEEEAYTILEYMKLDKSIFKYTLGDEEVFKLFADNNKDFLKKIENYSADLVALKNKYIENNL